LSAAARRGGLARQRATAVWPPRATPTARFKAAIGKARRASRQLPPRTPRHADSCRPALRAASTTATPRPDSASRSPLIARRPALHAARPNRRPALRAAVPTASPTTPRPDRSSLINATPSSVVPAPVSRYPSAASRAPAPRRRRLVEQHRRALRHHASCAGRGRGPRRCRARGPCPAWPRAALRTVHLGRERFRTSCTRLNFINF
jgi:hypothetical protein